MKLITLISFTIAIYIAEPLTYICNLSFFNRYVLKLKKKSKLFPSKSCNLSDFNKNMFEYSIFENLRKIIFSRLLSFCDFHNIIGSS